MDRADIVQYVGLPPREAIYWILSSCLKELMRAGIITSVVSQPRFVSIDVRAVDDFGPFAGIGGCQIRGKLFEEPGSQAR